VIDNYGKDKAEAQLEWLVGTLMDHTIDESAITHAGLDVVSTVLTYISQLSTISLFDFNCSEVFQGGQETINSLCEIDPTGGYYNCSSLESDAEALCAIFENPDLIRESPDLFLALLESTGLSVGDVRDTIRFQVASGLDSVTESLYPEELYMLTIPLGFVIFFAVVTALQLAISYIPSVTTTIIQLRTGVIPSLGNSAFEKYRVAPDSVTLLTGTLFWGCLVSSILFGFVVGFIIFLFLWQGSVRLVQRFMVIAIGFLIVIAIRLLVSVLIAELWACSIVVQ
jgi:hypothetical protein